MTADEQQPRWWALAFSDEVDSTRPLGVRCGVLAVTLFRDTAGSVRAVEDRCPHRRAPLSLGRITPDGQLQCGYHGWTFSGSSGRLTAIPNQDPGERVLNCSIATYAAAERQGLVHVWSGDPAAADPEQIPQLSYAATPREFRGNAVVPVVHAEFIAGLLDCPGNFICYRGTAFDGKAVGDARLQDGMVVTDRAANWNWLGADTLSIGPLHHRADYPLLFRSQAAPVTGLMSAQLCNNEGRVLVDTLIASAPSARGTTAVRWRAAVATDVSGYGAQLIAALARAGISPFRIRPRIDGRRLAAALPGPAETWRELSHPGPAPKPMTNLLATA